MRLNFRKKALLFILPILAIVSIIYTIDAIRTEKDIMRTEIMKRAEAITTLATKTGELPILSGNPELLRSTMAFLRGNAEVVSVAFYDNNMNLLVRDGVSISGRQPVLSQSSSISMFDEGDTMVFFAPVFTIRAREDIDIFQESAQARQVRENIGWVRLGFSKAPMREAAEKVVKRGAVIAVVFTLGSSVAVFFLITIFTKPLTLLHNAVRKIEKGEYPDIKVDSSDEVGELAAAFDGMSRAIKDRESRLVESGNRIRELFERVEHAIFRLDPTGRIIQTNRKFDELCGETGSFCDLFPGEQSGVRLQRAASGELKNSEETIAGKDNSELSVIMSVYPGFDGNGDVSGFDGYFVDISEKKNLEESLFHSQKLESLGMLAGGIAHDFNNILTGVLGYSSLSKSMVAESDRIFKYLDIIEKSAVRASNLAAQLLGFARKGKYVMTKLCINDLVRELAGFLRETFNRNIEIVLECEDDLPPVEGDNNQLYQALMNLCINARDAMSDGGRLYIKTDFYRLLDEKVVDFFQIPAGEFIRISVTDTGIGMTPDVKKRIFEPFYTTKDVGKGTGLGLAMVYGIVKNHGGYLSVYSEEGLGTTIRLYLPKSEGRVEEKVKAKPVSGKSKKGTILLVDDEEVIRELGKDILEAYDYEVFLASDGNEGVRLFNENKGRIDLVILDMVMPEKSGKQTFKEILSISPGTKVLLCSGYGQEQYFHEVFSAGAAGFLQKPFQHSELLGKVEEAMGN